MNSSFLQICGSLWTAAGITGNRSSNNSQPFTDGFAQPIATSVAVIEKKSHHYAQPKSVLSVKSVVVKKTICVRFFWILQHFVTTKSNLLWKYLSFNAFRNFTNFSAFVQCWQWSLHCNNNEFCVFLSNIKNNSNLSNNRYKLIENSDYLSSILFR